MRSPLEPVRRSKATLGRAAARHGSDYGALATTRRQLRAIYETLAIDPGLLRALAGPGVVYFCGHRTASEGEPGSFPAATEARCSASIANVIEDGSFGFAYGALAGGADILWAEALLAHGSELHIVLPFAFGEFVQTSVAPCGPGWVDRCEHLLAAATDVRYATDDAFLGDDVLFRYGGELAMGLALLRARYLDAEAWQLALWDGAPARGAAGTAIDVATWRRAGRPAAIVSPDGIVTTYPGHERPHAKNTSSRCHESLSSSARTSRRVVRAMLFGDIRGFSKLTDEQLPTFATRVLGALAEVVHTHQEHVSYRNTWGDALYLVLTDVTAAAFCALDLQKAMAAIDLASDGLPDQLALRLGGHLGPVFPTYDPVLGTSGFMGSHVSRTARIEPVTPPGAVYVTEAFAAALVLDGPRELTCDYVGHMSAAKSYGRLRMYRLRRMNQADDPTPSHRQD
jgi:class 3 adenylate cyclase